MKWGDIFIRFPSLLSLHRLWRCSLVNLTNWKADSWHREWTHWVQRCNLRLLRPPWSQACCDESLTEKNCKEVVAHCITWRTLQNINTWGSPEREIDFLVQGMIMASGFQPSPPSDSAVQSKLRNATVNRLWSLRGLTCSKVSVSAPRFWRIWTS